MTGQRSQRCGLPLESRVSLVAMVMLLLVTPTSSAPKKARAATDETSSAREWLGQMNTELAQVSNTVQLAAWAYATNITDATQRASTAASIKEDEFLLKSADGAAQFHRERVTDPMLALELKRLADKGTVLSDPVKAEKRHRLVAEMEGIFSTAKVCLNSTQHPDCMPLDPDLYRILKTSRDWDELLAVWKGWRDVSGAKMRAQYQEMVQLENEGARENGHNDTGDAWRANYESDTFQEDVAALWEELLPLYRQVHTYVRGKLKEVYGPHHFPATGHIPAHILGEMWSQQWHIFSLVQPFKLKQAVDVTPALKAQNYTVEKMFRLAESFYESLGMEPMTDTFWKRSMLSKPTDGREVVCYASAWDLFNRDDFRIKMCTDITMEDLVTIHHEMGHVQYYMQYKVQPPFFRKGANHGFHEAIGDTIALSVMTPQHLQKVGLLDEIQEDNETDINFLMKMAVEKVAFLPFGYLIDQWRWSVFSGKTTPDHYNEKWWELRCRYQGLSAPVARSEKDFDPGCKYHVAANVPYIRYFVSHVLQFQFHQALCREAGHIGPLHKCDIYNSRKAGEKLMAMLRLGSSKPWPDVLEVMTGTRKMQASALLDYFRPLQDWLEEQNKDDHPGWANQCPDPDTGKVTDEEEARRFLEKMEKVTQEVDTKSSLASWNYATNLTDENLEASVAADMESTRLYDSLALNASVFDWNKFKDGNLTRAADMMGFLYDYESSDPDREKRLSEVSNRMEGIYSKGTVVIDNKTMELEPDLTRLLAQSRDYNKLVEAWQGWRDAVGRPMKKLYQEYVTLSNQEIKEGDVHDDKGSVWRSWYEVPDLKGDMERLLEQLAPLYQQLHAYVRRKLQALYPDHPFPKSGHIPAHLFGNMWAQEWSNIYDVLEPFKGKAAIDVTPEMKAQNYTVLGMFRTAESFYQSLGFLPLPKSFYLNSMMEKPKDGRDVVCHASAWDFSTGHDFRIKMCTDITMEDLITIHHEMGHIQYYIQYKDQPGYYRTGANPGFHEAVGDTMALSVTTPAHLQKINLLHNLTTDTETDINFLMKMALDKVAFLPFGYLIDQWRWSVFGEETPPERYNEKWWELRCKYQGINPPVHRTEEDFDAGAKYHVPAGTPYIRYFVSFVIQFQFHQALCREAGHTGPLHTCDIYNSKEAGKKLMNMLSMGKSRPWPEAMEAITGQREMDVRPLLDYFKPLLDWLEEQNSGQSIGWDPRCPAGSVGKDHEYTDAVAWLREYDTKAEKARFEATDAEFTYDTNLTDYNQQRLVDANLRLAQFSREAAQNASRFDWEHLSDESVRRQFQMIRDIGPSALTNDTALARMERLRSDMEGIYSKARVCLEGHDRCLDLEPDLTRLMAQSRDYTELERAWKGWRDVTGPKMRESYQEFVSLSNQGVQELGFKDTGEWWRSWYESEDFRGDLEQLLEELRPLYAQLHTYVRAKLAEVYGEDRMPTSGHIPAHLTGNMWAQSWENIYDLVQPFPNSAQVDATPELVRQGYTVEAMFHVANEFYTSLGLIPLPMSFWRDSMLKKPTDGREVVCHASAWDFYNGWDFKIKMCTDITMEDLVTIHHEMGHIQYYMQYKAQPQAFKDGANPGFHEAIGDVMALSVSTPAHLAKIGLLRSAEHDQKADINFLMKMALEKVAFLPFGYLIDQWRWSVFGGETPLEQYNQKWWELRCKHQGVAPPVQRSTWDFDPGAKYHVPSNYPYIRYFVSFVIQFQFHKALCAAANQTGPLHTCDIYRSKAAGDKLSSMLRLGSSLPWREAMKVMTGQDKMDVGPLLEYFRPLREWLEKENAGRKVGWTDACPDARSEELGGLVRTIDRDLGEYRTLSTIADWQYNTNLTDYNSNMSVSAGLRLAEFQKKAAGQLEAAGWRQLPPSSTRREIEKLTDIGTAAMKDPEQLERLENLQARMTKIYSTGKVTVGGQTLDLDPGLTRLLAESRDYNTLTSAWRGWHDTVGRPIRPLYKQFVSLSNQAIKDLGFPDTGAWWRSWYESATFQQDLEDLLRELRPLYSQLHAYVRRKLMDTYGKDKFPASGHIPAHLLGNMWAQQWNNIYDMLMPFPNRSSVDVTTEMKRQGFTVMRMFRTAEDFFQSLGLEAMPATFWNGSMLEKPKDGREVVCHASAWDFYDAKDFRIKMCTDITMEDLVTIHHEMGHIQYFLQYRHQPQAFRDGANPGFHEAIGDVMALSVSTPAHLAKLKLLLSSNSHNNMDDINFLMNMALEKIAFLPFGYLIDQWRWSVFSGETPFEQYNQKWWELRCRHQGLSPPVPRSEEDFDPGAKFHIPDNTPYIRYFVSFVIQFQFHQALCREAGHTGPLHTCDIYNSKKAGEKLISMLRLGSSLPWREAMKVMTGQDKMEVGPLLEYFRPLREWLEKENADQRVGWTDACPVVRIEELGGLVRTIDRELGEYRTLSTIADWQYNTNLTDYNSNMSVVAGLRLAEFQKKAAGQLEAAGWRLLPPSSTRREIEKLTDIGTAAMKDTEQLEQLETLQARMTKIYSTGKVTVDGQILDLDPGLTRLLAESRDYNKLTSAWRGWHDTVGRPIRPLYKQFVSLSNQAIKDLGFPDTGAWWQSWYESKTFQQDLEDLLQELHPLYSQLHAYVRRKLMDTYGKDKFPASGHIPAQLLGNMWAQHWNNIYDLTMPFPNRSSVDVTSEMKRQGFTVMRMFRTAEDFFQSLGLEAMPATFWNGSMLEKPKDGREVVCHASAWDFYDAKDFRIKMCTDITMEDLVTIHHEMGHIQYFLQYRHQPQAFRDGANPGFHEAIGDVMALSVSTPAHLAKLKLLLSSNSHNNMDDINFLMKMALDKIAFLPFGYLIDQWRWSVFSGETPFEQYNQKWWELRCRHQGLSSPVPRSEEDFDPGAKFHIPDNTPYIRYFVSFVIQFQFHQALCREAGHTGPLHTCDIYNSKKAGEKLISMLRLGSSLPWRDAMKVMTGQDKMEVGPLLEYFRPLREWLEKENAGQRVGWTDACPDARSEELGGLVRTIDRELGEYRTLSTIADWQYNTNLTDYNSNMSVSAGLRLAEFQKKAAGQLEAVGWRQLPPSSTRREIEKLTDIGTAAMKDPEQLERLENLQARMTKIYSTGKVTVGGQNLDLDPGLTRLLAESRDYNTLTSAWRGWHDTVGRPIRPLYKQFVSLSNQAIKDLGFPDTGAWWRSWYESETFQQDLEDLLRELRPLYSQLHAYVRRKLMDTYGKDKFPASGHIPAHLLGNMWAQQWNNIYDMLMPFPNRSSVDITLEMKRQGFTVMRMFRTAEDFFQSLGLEAMPATFWNGSMLEKPKDGREVVCHASAWDFYDAKDFRIKMCTDITMEDLVTIHHEMGHIQYFLQYRHQPQAFRDGANPGFHEAIGDVMALSVSTPAHLAKLKLLLSANSHNNMDDINFLMNMALEKIAFLPFGYLIDQWRWSVFSGETPFEQYNQKWWELRCRHQGLSPPVPRSEEDFDPGAKFHIPDNTPYIRYFVSFVIQFQFHQALCREAGHTGPLHTCDIYNSKKAGEKLMAALRLGSSRPWPEVMEVITGQRKMDAQPLLEYFKPLSDWLEVQNVNERPGWSDACPQMTSAPPNVAIPPRESRGSNSASAVTSSMTSFALTLLAVVIFAFN